MRIVAPVVIAVFCPMALAAQGTAVLQLRALSDANAPLGNTLVSIPQLRVTRFTDVTGGLTVTDLPPGALHIEIRRLGFQPKDTTVAVAAGSTHTAIVTLTRVALRLMPISVVARERCEHPGPPGPHSDAALATAFEQLRMNADQYNALVRAYPFVYSLRRSFGRIRRDNSRLVDESDSVDVSAVPLWRYAPGRVVVPNPEPKRGVLFMHLPTMDVFADSVFIANHCFHNGGIERSDGGDSYFRIDFIAADSLRTPDFEGSIFLDLESLVVRRTVLRLSRLPPIRHLLGLESATEFIEVAPSVPVIQSVYSKHVFGRSAFFPEIFEEQKLIGVRFLRARPAS
jgi:hypothetical protein